MFITHEMCIGDQKTSETKMRRQKKLRESKRLRLARIKCDIKIKCGQDIYTIICYGLRNWKKKNDCVGQTLGILSLDASRNI